MVGHSVVEEAPIKDRSPGWQLISDMIVENS